MAGDRRVDRRTMGEPWRMGREGEGNITGDAQREIKDASDRCVCETCERRKRRGSQESDAQDAGSAQAGGGLECAGPKQRKVEAPG